MQIVIDVPKYDTFPAEMKIWGLEAIRNGTPLQSCEDIAKAFQFGLAFGFGEKHNEMVRVIDEIKKVITPQLKTGHWIKTISENGITSAVRCSECGFEDNRYMLFRYCPSCGAKMVEPQESEG